MYGKTSIQKNSISLTTSPRRNRVTQISRAVGVLGKRQMEVYQWLFRRENFPVSDLGYFLYVNGIKGDNDFYSDHQGYEDVGFMELDNPHSLYREL